MGWFGRDDDSTSGLPREFIRGVKIVLGELAKPNSLEPEVLSWVLDGVGPDPQPLPHQHQRDRVRIAGRYAGTEAVRGCLYFAGSPAHPPAHPPEHLAAFARFASVVRDEVGRGPATPSGLTAGMLTLAQAAAVPLTVGDLDSLLLAADFTRRELLSSTLYLEDWRRLLSAAQTTITSAEGFDALLLEFPDVVRERLAERVDLRVAVLKVLAELPNQAVLSEFTPDVVAAACSASAQVREAAAPVLQRMSPDDVNAALRELAVKGKPPVRALAIDQLWDRGEREFAHATALADRAASVRELTETWELEASVDQAPVDDALSLPDLPPLVWNEMPPAQARALADAVFRDFKQVLRNRPHAPERLLPEAKEQLLRTLVDGVPPARGAGMDQFLITHPRLYQSLTDPAVPLSAVAAVLVWSNYWPRLSRSYVADSTLNKRVARGGEVDLRRLVQMTQAADLGMELPVPELVWKALTAASFALGVGWPAGMVWPFLVEHLDVVLADATLRSDYERDAEKPYQLLGCLPAWHPKVVEFLYGNALGSSTLHRRFAQRALADHPERAARAAVELTNGKAEVRIAAADWLTEIAEPTQLPALQQAFKKEKNDQAKAALLDALEALGESVTTYLDPAALLADATKAAKKALPSGLEWLNPAAFPAVHWKDSEEPVDPLILRHLCVNAMRGKTPEPNALQTRYGELMVATDAARFAEHLLKSWIAADTGPISPDEAQRRAHRDAVADHQWAQSMPGHQFAGWSVADIEAALLLLHLGTPRGSATASKGVLALVSAWGDEQVAGPCNSYVRQWYGQRAAQCKALLAVLAWNDSDAAISVLLAIGNRFRTAGIKEEAARLVQELAERRHWTLEQLADRTVPTAGYEEDGTMRLDYSAERWFVATIGPDARAGLAPVLVDQEGAKVRALPAPRVSDNPEAVAASKKALAAAKKALKSITDSQRERWFEAMCAQRLWLVGEWQEFLLEHPVVRHLVSRVVWEVVRDSEAGTGSGAGSGTAPVSTFRPLGDGSLSDQHDNDVQLDAHDPALRIRIAHDAVLPDDVSAAWAQHLVDYEVDPFLSQFGRGAVALTPELERATHILDREGFVLSSFQLRSRATKLGWHRGEVVGANFYEYVRPFPATQVTAEIAFTGSWLPEEERAVALQALSFRSATGDHLALCDVPPVLLHETWNDWHDLAAAGTGFDEDWRRITQV